MWRHFCSSVRGTSHESGGLRCQDASLLVLCDARAETLVLALSDGAGSARHAEQGAALVVRIWSETFSRLLADRPDPAAVLEACAASSVEEILCRIAKEVAREAAALGALPEDFSATLLGAVLTPSNALLAQVGDGCWVGLVEEGLSCLTWPLGGEFAGQTTFATSPGARTALQLVHLPRAPAALAGFTDGLERLLIDFQTRLPAAGFFLPTFEALRQDTPGFHHHMEAFLRSEKVCVRTDDDKSLALVVRDSAEVLCEASLSGLQSDSASRLPERAP
jgi:hypothetical protein